MTTANRRTSRSAISIFAVWLSVGCEALDSDEFADTDPPSDTAEGPDDCATYNDATECEAAGCTPIAAQLVSRVEQECLTGETVVCLWDPTETTDRAATFYVLLAPDHGVSFDPAPSEASLSGYGLLECLECRADLAPVCQCSAPLPPC